MVCVYAGATYGDGSTLQNHCSCLGVLSSCRARFVAGILVELLKRYSKVPSTSALCIAGEKSSTARWKPPWRCSLSWLRLWALVVDVELACIPAGR